MEASNRFESFKSLSGLPHFQDGNYSVHQKLPSSWPVDFSGPQGCILPHSHGSFGSQTAHVSSLGQVVPVCGNAFWPSHSSQGIHYLSQGSEKDGLEVGHLSSHVPRRLAYQSQQLSGGLFCNSNFVGVDSQAGVDCKQGEVRLASKASFHLPGPGFRPVQGGLLSNRGQVPVYSGGYSSFAFQPPYYSTPGYAPFGSTSLYREVSTSGSPSYATLSISSQEELQLPPERCPGFSIRLGPFSEGSFKVVVTEEQCHGASSTASTQICNIHLHGCLSSGLGAHCAHMIAQGHWSTQQSKLHINVLELKELCPSVIPSSKDYSGSLRQHNCLCLHKQTRGHSLLGHVCPDLAPVCLLSQEQSCSYSKTRSGVMNLVADQLSRSQQILHTEWSLNPKIFRWLSQIDFQPQIDLFATRFNHKLPQYVSPVPDPKVLAVDALEMNWSGLHLYSFPPRALCPLVVKRLINSQSCRMLLVAPLWETKEWLQDLLALSIRRPIALPLKENILKQPHLEVFRQNLRNLNLHAFWLKSP